MNLHEYFGCILQLCVVGVNLVKSFKKLMILQSFDLNLKFLVMAKQISQLVVRSLYFEVQSRELLQFYLSLLFHSLSVNALLMQCLLNHIVDHFVMLGRQGRYAVFYRLVVALRLLFQKSKAYVLGWEILRGLLKQLMVVV